MLVPLRLAVGAAAAVLLFRFRVTIEWLARLGGYAYTIFLFHVFGTAGVAFLLRKIHISSEFIQFSMSLGAGLLAPVLVDHACRKNSWSSLFLLGLRTRRRPMPRMQRVSPV